MYHTRDCSASLFISAPPRNRPIYPPHQPFLGRWPPTAGDTPCKRESGIADRPPSKTSIRETRHQGRFVSPIMVSARGIQLTKIEDKRKCLKLLMTVSEPHTQPSLLAEFRFELENSELAASTSHSIGMWGPYCRRVMRVCT